MARLGKTEEKNSPALMRRMKGAARKSLTCFTNSPSVVYRTCHSSNQVGPEQMFGINDVEIL